MQTNRRSKKLVRPRFQLRLIASFVGMAVLGMSLQFLWLGNRLLGALAGLDGTGSGELARTVPGMLLGVLGATLLLLLPVLFGVGLVLTHRIVGPLHRIESYLQAVARGEETEPCQLRDRDELGSLCDAVNAATESRRQANAAGEQPASERAGEGQAAEGRLAA